MTVDLQEGYNRFVMIVGLHGQAYSGKDESRLLLGAMAEQNLTKVVELRYAEPLYRSVQALVPEASPLMPKAEKERPREELGGLSIRQFLLIIGEGSEHIVKDAWVKVHRQLLYRLVTRALDEGFKKILVVIPDLRMEKERAVLAELLKQEQAPWQYDDVFWGGVVVHLRAKNAPVNENPDARTETPLEVQPGELVVENNHQLGSGNLAMVLFDELTHPISGGWVANLARKVLPSHPKFQDAAEKAALVRQRESHKWASK